MSSYKITYSVNMDSHGYSPVEQSMVIESPNFEGEEGAEKTFWEEFELSRAGVSSCKIISIEELQTCEVCGQPIAETPEEDTGCITICKHCHESSEKELQAEGILA